MLVLARKKEQSIIVNRNVEIKIIYCNTKMVKLGIIAPVDVTVDRKEIHIQKYGSGEKENDDQNSRRYLGK